MPANREMTMRQMRQVLRLHASQTSDREIGRIVGAARSTVRDAIQRAKAAGLAWPLPEDLTDAALEEKLFARAGARVGTRRRPEPDWAHLVQELKRPGVSIAILHEEYLADHPDGYGYSRFCDLVRSFERRLTPTMRQHHVAGDKVFVDYSGKKLPIVDPHHHLWDHATERYFLDELLADTGSGHNVTATVFIDCRSMYRVDGPSEMRPVGETEFANGVAAMSASGLYGPTRACAGIVSYVDMMLGARARPALEAHVAAGNGRFRGIRHAAGWDASPDVRNSHTNPPPGLYGQQAYRDGVAAAGLAVDEDGRVYACDNRARQLIRTDKKNKTDVLASVWEGKKFNGPADVVVLRKDHVYFTDPAFGSADASKELAHYGIYHVGPKGEMSIIAKLAVRPNGIALSPDGKTLYATVADERSVLAWSLDRNGVATQQRVFASGIDGVPDGIDTAPDGRVFVAARALVIYAPDGKLISTQPTPEKPVDIAIGEADMNTVFIAAGSSVYRFRLPDELQNKTGARH